MKYKLLNYHKNEIYLYNKKNAIKIPVKYYFSSIKLAMIKNLAIKS